MNITICQTAASHKYSAHDGMLSVAHLQHQKCGSSNILQSRLCPLHVTFESHFVDFLVIFVTFQTKPWNYCSLNIPVVTGEIDRQDYYTLTLPEAELYKKVFFTLTYNKSWQKNSSKRIRIRQSIIIKIAKYLKKYLVSTGVSLIICMPPRPILWAETLWSRPVRSSVRAWPAETISEWFAVDLYKSFYDSIGILITIFYNIYTHTYLTHT